jgi:hypothetical protein
LGLEFAEEEKEEVVERKCMNTQKRVRESKTASHSSSLALDDNVLLAIARCL